MLKTMTGFAKDNCIRQRKSFMRIISKFFNMMNMFIGFATTTRTNFVEIFSAFIANISFISKNPSSEGCIFGMTSDSGIRKSNPIFPIGIFGAFQIASINFRKFFFMFQREFSAFEEFTSIMCFNSIFFHSVINKCGTAAIDFRNFLLRFSFFDIKPNQILFCNNDCSFRSCIHGYDTNTSSQLCQHEKIRKSGEFRETPNVKPRAILSQAIEGNGSIEGATTRRVSPNNNLSHERPTRK